MIRRGLGRRRPSTTAAGGAAVFDPATLNPILWNRADDFTVATGIWTPTAPAARNLDDAAAGLIPADGTVVNGHTSVDFQGVDLLELDGAHTVVGFLGSTYTLLVLVNFDALGADTTPDAEKGIFSESTGSWGLVTGASGVRLWTFDGATKASPYTVLSTGTWTWVKAKKAGGNLYSGKNSDAWSAPTASGDVSGGGGLIRFGYSTGTSLDAKVLEVMAFGSELSDADITDVISYGTSRYGV